MLQKGNTIAFVGNSNAQSPDQKELITQLIELCKELGLQVLCSPILYEINTPYALVGKQKADVLMNYYKNDSVDAIIDISGGDLANSILPYLDYEVIKQNPKPYWGYSDLTSVLNAIYQKTGNIGVLYQFKNLMWDQTQVQIGRIKQLLMGDKELFQPEYHFLNGTSMEGTLIGGNIRCLLKLAGTPYMPELAGKILLLEGMGGGVEQYATYLSQLLELPSFSQLNGILLGTFTNMEAKQLKPTVEEMLQSMLQLKDTQALCGTPNSAGTSKITNLPIAKTMQIGHGSDSKALIIGKYYQFE